MRKLNVEKMNLKQFGWEVLDETQPTMTTKTEFTKLQNGITELRFLDESPFVRWAHWINTAKRNISCLGATCPVCESIKASKSAGARPAYTSNRKFAMHVLNLNTGKVEILEQGKTFFTQLRALHEEIGDIRNYNIKVKTQNAGSTDVTYTLMPMSPTELNEEQLEMVKDLKAFEEVFKVPTREQVLQLMSGSTPDEVFGNKSDEDEKIGL